MKATCSLGALTILSTTFIGCGGTLKYDLSSSPGLAASRAGLNENVAVSRSLAAFSKFSSAKAPTIGEGYDWYSLGGTAIPFAQLDEVYKPAVPSPPVEDLVFQTVEKALRVDGIVLVRGATQELANGLILDTSRFEMSGDGGASAREGVLECKLTLIRSGKVAYSRLVVARRTADFGTGAGRAVAGMSGAGMDAATEREGVVKLFGDLLYDLVVDLRGDQELIEHVRDAAENSEVHVRSPR